MFKKLVTIVTFFVTFYAAQAHAFTAVWSTSYNGTTNNYDSYSGVARDSSDNVYAVGASSNGVNNIDGLLSKYNSAGLLQLTTTYDSGLRVNNFFNAVTVDAADNIVVVGTERLSTASLRMGAVVRKYNPSGTLLFHSTYNSTTNAGFDAVDVDTNSNVWAVGMVDNNKALIQKYNSSGLLLFTTYYKNALNESVFSSIQRFRGVVVDTSGFVYSAGFQVVADTVSFPGTNSNVKYLLEAGLLQKRDSAGNLIWSTIYQDLRLNDNHFNAIAIDTGGNIVVAGGINKTGEALNFLVNKYDINGLLLQTTSYNSHLFVKDPVTVATTENIVLASTQVIDGVLVNFNDRVLVLNQSTATENGIYKVSTGTWARSTDADQNFEVVQGLFTTVLKGTSHGGLGYALITNDPITLGSTPLTFSLSANGYNYDEAFGVGVDSSNNTIVAGITDRADLLQNKNLLILKYNPTGTLLTDSTSYNLLRLNNPEGGTALTIDSADKVLSVGYEYNVDRLSDGLVRKLAQ